VVKCGLASRLIRPGIRPIIQDLVRHVSMTCHRLGLVVDYVVRRAVEEHESVPDICDATFIDRAMGMSLDARKKEQCLQRAWDVGGFSGFPQIERPSRIGKIAEQSARQTVATNMRNCLTEAFEARLTKYLAAWCMLNGTISSRITLLRKCIMGIPSDDECTLTVAEEQFVHLERALLQLDWRVGNLQTGKRGDLLRLRESWRKCVPMTSGYLILHKFCVRWRASSAEATERPLCRQNASLVWAAYVRWSRFVHDAGVKRSFTPTPHF
jgi:hypothetical protein